MKLRPRQPDEHDTLLALMHADLNVLAEWGHGVLAGESTPFLSNWHIEAINRHLALCAERKITRLLITVAPRYFKSHCASVCFPAWILGLDPKTKLMCVSYGEKPAVEFATQSRALMQTHDYRDAFPGTVLQDSAVDMIRTTAGGYRMATSVTGVATGFRLRLPDCRRLNKGERHGGRTA